MNSMSLDFVLQSNSPFADHLADFEARLQPEKIECPTPRTARLRAVQNQLDLTDVLDAAQLDGAYVASQRPWSEFRLLAMDMDSTLITIECIDEIADFAGVKSAVAAVTAAAMRGELEFQEALRRRVDLLSGLPVSVLESVFQERLRLSPGALELLDKAQSASMHTLLLSGGFTFFTNRLQQQLGLNETRANELEVRNETLTGRIQGPIVDGAVKARTVTEVADRLGIRREAILVVGDGANDLPMMRRAGVSIAYHAKPIVRKEATHSLNYVGLDGIPHLFTHS